MNENVTTIPANEWLVIINPNSGRRKGEKDWPVISKLLYEAGIEFLSVFTEHRNHALHLAEKFINEGFRKIIVVGGDGTLNEVVNGIFLQNSCQTTDIFLGMIMVGAGNDWGRMYSIPEDYQEAIGVIKDQRLFIQDAARVTFYNGDEKKQRYLVNMTGVGYDALVAQMTNKVKDKGGGGPVTYFVNIFKGLFKYHLTKMKVTIDGMQVYYGRVFSMNIGICRYNGGGMMQLPNAIPDDGILDVTIMKDLSKLDVIRNVSKLYDGSFIDLSFVQTHTGKEVTIDPEPPQASMIEVDGESVGHSPFSFEVVPKSIKLITGENWQKKNEEKKS